MTIKGVRLILHHKYNMNQFLNPSNKPIEELQLKYVSSENAYEEIIPALDPRWCNKDYLFTLYTSPPKRNTDGQYSMGSKEDWMERMRLFITDMDYLLKLEYHRFWSEVIYNSCCMDGLTSFLHNAPPFYMRQVLNDTDIVKVFKKAQETVLMLLMRLSSNKESQKTWMRSSTLGKILYNNFVISMPQLMEICLIYANDNFKEVTTIINKVIDIQPKYKSDIEKSITFICQILSKLEDQFSSENENCDLPLLASNQRSVKPVEIFKTIGLMLDISFSLATFLEICPKLGVMFHEERFELRIAHFYDNTIPVIDRYIESLCSEAPDGVQPLHYQLKLNLCRHQLLTVAHACLTAHLSTILEDRDGLSTQELKARVDNYLDLFSNCLSFHAFIIDYNSAFPIQRDLQTMCEICPEMDMTKYAYIEESVKSLYNLPPKPRPTPKAGIVPEDTACSSNNVDNHIQTPQEKVEPKIFTGVELKSLITDVKDILPHLGDGFVAKCLEHYNYVSSDVINALLEDTLPQSLAGLDQNLPAEPTPDTQESEGLPERINIYDNDEFDIMTNDKIDTSKIHKGKRGEKHKNLMEMLDDKSHVRELRDVYTHLGLVEMVENINDYEDEYDDTYDDVDVPVGNEGVTEAEERRAIVIPRVLQQYKKSERQELNCEDNDEEDEVEETKPDHFIENPADVRERAEQRRQDMRARGSGKPRSSFNSHDVVGKPKGQGQDKEVVKSREFKNTNKSSRGNHNRRAMAAKKRRQGMLPS